MLDSGKDPELLIGSWIEMGIGMQELCVGHMRVAMKGMVSGNKWSHIYSFPFASS